MLALSKKRLDYYIADPLKNVYDWELYRDIEEFPGEKFTYP